MKRRKGRPPVSGRPDAWEPLQPGSFKPWTDDKRNLMRAALVNAPSGAVPEEAADDYLAQTEAARADVEVWLNNRYVCTVERRPDDDSVVVISLRRTDRKPIRDWRDMQRIKNELAGYETEAVELFPADSRLMDSANQYWLWCLRPGERWPFGYDSALVASASPPAGGWKQRPLPDDPSFTLRQDGSIA